MPNKRMVTQYLDELSTAAALSGSVNTVVNDNGRLIGHNTDGYGFWESLRRNNIEFVSKKATLVGPGGVGAAICVQGALDGLGEIAIFTRVGKSEKTAKELVEKINANTSCKAAMYMIEDEAVLREQIADATCTSTPPASAWAAARARASSPTAACSVRSLPYATSYTLRSRPDFSR